MDAPGLEPRVSGQDLLERDREKDYVHMVVEESMPLDTQTQICQEMEMRPDLVADPAKQTESGGRAKSLPYSKIAPDPRGTTKSRVLVRLEVAVPDQPLKTLTVADYMHVIDRKSVV